MFDMHAEWFLVYVAELPSGDSKQYNTVFLVQYVHPLCVITFYTFGVCSVSIYTQKTEYGVWNE